MFKKQNIYSVKERFINDYRKSPQWGWLAFGAIWLTIVLMLIMAKPTLATSDKQKEKIDLLLREWVVEDYTTSLPDYPMEFGSILEASQKEMKEIYRRAKAISKAEGWEKKGSLAQRNLNPGNLKKSGYKRDRQGHSIFDTQVQGWIELYSLLYRHKDKTIYQIGRFYATDTKWAYNVIKNL